MSFEQGKTLVLSTWAVAVCLGAIAIGITSIPGWIVVACVALVPPMVARSFWRAPEQTISQSIDEARH